MSNEAERPRDAAKAIHRGAELENRDPTPEEYGRIEELLAKSRQARHAEEAVHGIARRYRRQRITRAGDGSRPFFGGDPGAAFVASEGYKRIQDPATRGQRFSTGAVKVPDFRTKGTLLEGTGAPGTGTGGGLLPAPTGPAGRRREAVPADRGDGPVRDHHREREHRPLCDRGHGHPGAAGVARARRSRSRRWLSRPVDEPVKKIATSITVSDELLDDAAAAQGFVGGRLSLFVRMEEERQLLRGAGTNELVGHRRPQRCQHVLEAGGRRQHRRCWPR